MNENRIPVSLLCTLTVAFSQIAGFASADEKPATAIFAEVSPAVVQIIVRDEDFKETAKGSGFFVRDGEWLVTNLHVVENAKSMSAVRHDGVGVIIKSILAADQHSDLAILEVVARDKVELTLADGDVPEVGTPVFAVGNPEGLRNTLSEGLISGIREIEGGPKLESLRPGQRLQFERLQVIQTTASISAGSSGGPLVGSDGRVLGVTTSQIKEGQNLNFVAPVQYVRGAMELAEATLIGRKAIDENPNHVGLYLMLSQHYRRSDLYEAAFDSAKQAAALKPDSAEAYFDMGIARVYSGRVGGGRSLLREAQKLDPDGEVGRNAKKFIEGLAVLLRPPKDGSAKD